MSGKGRQYTMGDGVFGIVGAPAVHSLQGRTGENHLRIEVATTLERECYPLLQGYRKLLAQIPACPSGLTGKVTLSETIP